MKPLNSLLIVDDDQETLSMCADLLRVRTGADVHTTQYPSQAFEMAMTNTFDVVILDVTMSYRGSSFGGLDLYRELPDRYGKSSLIAYSQYITDELLTRYNYSSFNFIETSRNAVQFVDKLVATAERLRRYQACFVAMPFAPEYDSLFAAIRRAIVNCDYKCVRVDQQSFTSSIIEKILTGIRDSKFVIFVATDRNPNAFYECGFAVALNKEVITVTDLHKNLPFDVRDRNAIAYRRKLSQFSPILEQRLRSLTQID